MKKTKKQTNVGYKSYIMNNDINAINNECRMLIDASEIDFRFLFHASVISLISFKKTEA